MALILLIDEDEDSCYLAERILSREGHDIGAFIRAEEALEWLRSFSPDFVIVSAGKYGKKAGKMLGLLLGEGMKGSRIILSAETGELGAIRRAFRDTVLEVIEKGNGYDRLLELIKQP